MLYVLKKEQIEHARLRALAQAIINREKGKEVFDDYMKAAFPWLETQKNREKTDHVQILMEEVKKGKLSIKPLWQHDPKIHSRMKTRVIQRDEQPKKSAAETEAFYAKLGKSIPI